jgi:2,3-dihydroxyphenylpropionate 1,2-dioxygenase
VTQTAIQTTPGATPIGDSGVLFGFCVSHAPQIFLRPAKEDPAEIDRVHAGYDMVAQRVRDLHVDALCIVALDHMHNHFLNLVPQFTIFTGSPVVAQFNNVRVECSADVDLANGLIDSLLDQDFDPAFSQNEVLDHSFLIPLHDIARGIENVPVIPIVINAYVPPQPSINRCYRLGQAIARWASRSGLRVGIVSTGGMSHYPGTDRFHHPNVEADHKVLQWLEAGEVDRLVSLDAATLDGMGMVEMRTWAVALGARGEGVRARTHSYWDSGHCGYAIVEF